MRRYSSSQPLTAASGPAAEMGPPHDPAAHEARALQDANVLGSRGKRHAQGRGELAEVPLPLGQAAQHHAPRRMRQGAKNPIQCHRAIFNHVV